MRFRPLCILQSLILFRYKSWGSEKKLLEVKIKSWTKKQPFLSSIQWLFVFQLLVSVDSKFYSSRFPLIPFSPHSSANRRTERMTKRITKWPFEKQKQNTRPLDQRKIWFYFLCCAFSFSCFNFHFFTSYSSVFFLVEFKAVFSTVNHLFNSGVRERLWFCGSFHRFQKKPKKYALVMPEKNPENKRQQVSEVLKPFELTKCPASRLSKELQSFMKNIVSSWYTSVESLAIEMLQNVK